MIIGKDEATMIFIERVAGGYQALFPRNDYTMVRAVGDSRIEVLRNLRDNLQTYLTVTERDAERLSDAINEVDAALDGEDRV
jgi:hypothetical protein